MAVRIGAGDPPTVINRMVAMEDTGGGTIIGCITDNAPDKQSLEITFTDG
jgi:hypothetical protein